jgi:hypothetical protein
MSNLSHEKTQDIVIQQIEEALCKASPGPWQHIGLRIYPIEGRPYATNEICVANRLPNAKLIANAPEWLLWQNDTIKRLTEENERLKLDLDTWVDKTDKWVERADNYRVENERLTSLLRQKEEENNRLRQGKI